MSAPRELKLVFTCPACQQAGEVSAAKMETVVSCPNCKTSVVIDREGIHDAVTHSRKIRRERKKSEEHIYGHEPTSNSGRWIAGFLLGVVGIATIPLATWIVGMTAGGRESKLCSIARGFQSAWLENDLDTAGTFVLHKDRDRFDTWSAPRRAGLVAGFGSKFQSRITDVEIVEQTESTATVRVAFEVAGRPQQAFLDWHLEDGQWRLRLH
jgi:hypothetical protein